MKQDLPDPRLVASARQVMDGPEEDEFSQETPLYITWFALGHVAVLIHLAVHALKAMTPMERGLAAGAIAVVGLPLALRLRVKARTAMATAETVGPASRRLAAEAED
jgi:hypothetical protein